MATRVLMTVRDKDQLIVGFKIINSKQGMCIKLFKKFSQNPVNSAEEYYKIVGGFENVSYKGHGQWEGIDCRLNSFPSIDTNGNPLDMNEKGKYFILGKYLDGDFVAGYKIMDLNGQVTKMSVEDTFALGNSEGFINAKIVGTPNEHGTKTYTISALKGTIRDFQIKKDSPKPTIVPNNDGQFSFGFDNNSKVGKVMDENTQKERYRKLSQMFGLKEEGKCTNADIAKVVGATSNADFSQKIHEYLGEDYTVSDKELLQKMYKVYKGMQAEKQQPVKPSIQKTVSIPNVAPVNPTNNVVQTSEPLKKDNADDSEDIKRMKELIKVLTKAAEVYYSGEDEIMSNYEYDKLYDELSDLEKKTGTVLQGSLTQQVGFEVKSKLTKVKHKYPALSLDKTKDRVELSNALGGQDGFLSWKLDGCFNDRAKISMADGTYKYIKDVKVGDSVLTVDSYGNLCAKPILNVFYNGKKSMEDWCKVYFSAKIDKYSTTVTKNHLFMTPKGWKQIGDLNQGDIVYKNDYILSDTQIAFMVGASFGDGSILNRNAKNDLKYYNGLEFRYSKKLNSENTTLLNRYEMLFKDILGGVRKSISGYNSEIYTRFLRTLYSLPIELYNKSNIFKTSMHFNKNTLKYLGDLGLAIYYIDDGSKTQSKIDGDNVKNVRSRVTFSMYRYPLEDIQIFSEYLKEKYNIESKIRLERKLKDGSNGYVLDINADSTEIFFDIVSPYIPKEIRKRKVSNLSRWQDLPEIEWWRNVGHYGVYQTPISYIDKLDKRIYNNREYRISSYDLEVADTHAYFANNLLVHNCTTVLTYGNGELQQVVTRGDGKIGEDITHNAKFFAGVPLKIGYKDDLVVRGEALITYEQFDKINSAITNIEDKYKNPRNLASGSIRQLDSKIAKERNVRVVAFTVVEGFDNLSNYTEKLDELKKYGFETVEYVKVTKDTTVKAIEEFEKRVKLLKYPTDGLVITIDNIAYGDMLGTTAKFPRNAKAFKWKDENYESEMLDIDWSVGRTGAITPVAVFKPVDIEGSTVRRASVHNVSIFKQLKLGKGDTVNIFKANLIIPQIASNITQSGTFEIPKVCPICGHPTSIVKANDAEVLMCNNPDCTARHLGSLSHFVSRDCMNIDGLSDATLEVFVNEGFVKTFKDIYHLNQYENKIVALDGFGKGSYNKIWKAIEASRECELPAFIGSLGIPQLGKGTSKDVCKAIDYDLNKLVNMSEAELSGIPGVGGKTAKEVSEYFAENKQMVLDLAEEMHFKAMPKIDHNSPIAGMTFCITGDVYTFKNRKELQAKIESLGAKAAGSVSAKTTYLINNDVTSESNKNQTAKKLGVPIISEADFLKMIGE